MADENAVKKLTDAANDMITQIKTGFTEHGDSIADAATTLITQFAEAIPDFDTAIAAEAETEKSYFARAICRTKTGEREGALADYDWVVLHGKDPDLFTEASRQIQTLLNDSGSTEDNEGADNQ